ncbi:MAG TPA: NapC/NirT family cytochrome c [Vicinamibacterales bacterium]|nr:NapC/NirT family cytochrome c [Vicinamibacterales bacterium]
MRIPTIPETVRNPVSLLGMALATATSLVFLALLLFDLLGYLTNPYVGLLIFITVPALFVFSLLLIPIGAWWSARRRRAGFEVTWPVIDLSQPRQRAILASVLALTLVNVLIVSAAGVGTVHYMERTEFCGQVCHTTMEPEFMAHQVWPHAQVRCVACHVGPGVGSFIDSKLAGSRQLYHLITNQVPRPVPTPVRSLGRTSDTCGGCHAADRAHGDVPRVIREYANDEVNTETVSTLQMHVGNPFGGPGAGIHRHIALDIEYVATDDSRTTIPYVRVLNAPGGVREYVAEGTTSAQISAGTRRGMDCIDCHNRPAHTTFFTPERAIDSAIASGRVPRTLAFVRREAVEAVKADHPDKAAADAAIATRLDSFYGARSGTDPALVRQAIAGIQDVWSHNIFPSMRVKWGTYPNHLGHVDTPGCFRCHDDGHKTKDGAVIKQDCELCHAIQ